MEEPAEEKQSSKRWKEVRRSPERRYRCRLRSGGLVSAADQMEKPAQENSRASAGKEVRRSPERRYRCRL